MASTLPETPTLLQEQCLQYLIDHLEDIPVEALALLPTAIRRTLAVHLPVADILQLEQTRFASGLDMPGVWKEVCEIRQLLSRYPKLVEMFENEIDAKEFVMMVVTYEVLHHHEEKPLNLQAKRDYHRLVRKPHNFQPHIPGPSVFFSRICIESPLKAQNCAVPSRFLNMHLDSSILKLLSTRYHICLERLYFDYNCHVGRSNLVEVLPRLKQLSISCMNYGIMHCIFALRSLLSGCSQCLHTLTLDDCPDKTIEMIVSTVVSVFTKKPVNFQSLRHFRVAVYCVSGNRYYGWGTRPRGITTKSVRSVITLCEAIQTHCLLHSFSLRLSWGDGRDIFDHDILGSILSLFQQPQFQCLTLRQTSLSLENIQHLVHTFLTTPCNGPQTLKLEYIQCHIFRTDHTGPSIPNSSTDFLLHKSLVLHLVSSPIDRVLKWLSTICKLHLHSLTVTMD